jgi:hypothetical protein
MPRNRPAPLQIPARNAFFNEPNQIDLESQDIIGRIKRHEYMDAAFAETDRHIAKVVKITCAVIRPVGSKLICIAVKNISDIMKKVTPINTIFFYNLDEKMWLPMSSIFNRRPSSIFGHIEERIRELTESAARERRSLAEFRAYPDVVSIRTYGIFGGMNNAICSQLLKEHSDDIIELVEDEGKIVVLTQQELYSFEVSELARTPDGFFADYNRQCVTFDVHVEHHSRHKKVSVKTRPAEKLKHTIDDLLSARFKGLRLPRESHQSKSSRRFSKSRKARPVMPRNLSKKKDSKPDNKKANNGAANPDNSPK